MKNKTQKEIIEAMKNHGVLVAGDECQECISNEFARKTKLLALQKLQKVHEYTIGKLARVSTTEREIVAVYVIARPCNIVAKLGQTKNLLARLYQHLHNKQRSNLNVKIKEHPWWEQDMYSYKVDFVEVPAEYLDPIERLFLKWFRPGKQS